MNEVVMLPEVWLVLVSTGIVPLLTAALTKAQSSGPRHAAVAAVLAAVLAVINQVQAEGATVEMLIVTFLTSLLLAAGAYVAAWQPLGVNEKVLPEAGV